jgi:hypothetical protein
MPKIIEHTATRPGPPDPERPSGLAYAGFTLGIAGLHLPGVPLVARPLSGAALFLDPRAGRRAWAAAWGLGLSVLGLLTQLGMMLEVVGAS